MQAKASAKETPSPRIQPPAGESCSTCKFYFNDPRDPPTIMRCRALPPYAGIVGGGQTVDRYWPKVIPTDWCGNYEVP